MVTQAKAWFTERRILFVGLALQLLIIFSQSLLGNNDVKNKVEEQSKHLDKIDKQIIKIDDKKMDKENMQLLLQTLSDMKQDIRDIKSEVINQINRSR